ncbi:hypothetical protein [Labrys wisconsinensis]|uniref:Uncharacterized protein n=1 Tax=Labrys wisconsinensis TaxID=425677 RepID=A0ABU0JKR8_9HYPH|nr:hypothetical protein [Labrys wisconsinensis]MDQ0474874.1 hypothetical protein [Labrys wisconsinensis]
MTGVCRGIGASALLCLGLAGPAAGAPRLAAGPGFSISYDDTIWAERPAVPPAALVLACIAPGCGDAAAALVLDPRPTLSPGAGAFTPGAMAPAGIDLAMQALTPGARVLAETPARPAASGEASGYCGRYTIEDAALARRDLVACLARLDGRTLHLRLTAARLGEEQVRAFDALRATLRPTPGPPAR